MALLIKDLIAHIVNPTKDWRLLLLHKWPTIVGSLKTRIRLERIYQTTLIIGVYESHWMQELFILSRMLMQTINKHLGHPYVTELKFKLIEPLPLEKKAESLENQVLPYAPVSFTVAHHQALNHVYDDQLRNVLTHFFIRCSINQHQ